jgi:ppGpp synthetase/RelA/SpoT-type nucleotidyltranferase
LSQISDIAGCRLVVDNQRDQDEAIDDLRVEFPSAKVLDRRLRPSHGYRAVHVIAEVAGFPVEVQVRTSLQHVWAQLSERLSDANPAIKYGGGAEHIRAILDRLSMVMAEYDSDQVRLVEGARTLALERLRSSRIELDSPNRGPVAETGAPRSLSKSELEALDERQQARFLEIVMLHRELIGHTGGTTSTS